MAAKTGSTYIALATLQICETCLNDILLLFVTVANVLTYRKSANTTVTLCQCMGIFYPSDIYGVARAISIFGFGDHILTSGC